MAGKQHMRWTFSGSGRSHQCAQACRPAERNTAVVGCLFSCECRNAARPLACSSRFTNACRSGLSARFDALRAPDAASAFRFGGGGQQQEASAAALFLPRAHNWCLKSGACFARQAVWVQALAAMVQCREGPERRAPLPHGPMAPRGCQQARGHLRRFSVHQVQGAAPALASRKPHGDAEGRTAGRRPSVYVITPVRW